MISKLHGSFGEKGLAFLGLKVQAGILYANSKNRYMNTYTKGKCESLREGTCFIPAKFFGDIVKELPEGLINLKTTSKTLTIKTTNAADVSWIEQEASGFEADGHL